MAIGDDFEIQLDRDIRYTGTAHEGAGAGYHTVYDFHVWLRGLAYDAQAVDDDFLDITRPTPSDKQYDTIIQLINGYNIDQTAAEHLYQGSIIQAGGDDIWDGMQIVAAEGCPVDIVQDGAVLSNDFWNSTPNGETEVGLNRDVANGISSRFMVKVRTAGTDIDGRRLICQTRKWLYTFSEFKVNGTGRGVNVVPLNYELDLNNETSSVTVAGWTGITNSTSGYVGLDVNNDSTDEYYYSEWNRSTYTINQFYERMKYLVRSDTAETLYGLNGELFRGITHEVVVNNPTGTFSAYEGVTWTGGTGQMLAINSVTAATKMWIQLLTGVAPSGTQTITGVSTATADVNTTVTERSVSTPFCGVSTGTSLIGAYGFCLEVLDLSDADKVFDLDGNPYQAPPSHVTFTLGNLDATGSNEDELIIGPRGYRFAFDGETSGPFTIGGTLTFTSPAGTAKLADYYDNDPVGLMFIGPILTGDPPVDDSTISGATAGADVNGTVHNDIDVRQFSLDGLLNGVSVTSVVVTEVIPVDTPATGQIRIKRADGVYTKHAYSAWDGPTKTFTITSHNFSTNNAVDDTNVFIGYLDMTATSTSEAFTSIYSGTDRSLFIRVRNSGNDPIKTSELLGTLGSAGGSANAGRTAD